MSADPRMPRLGLGLLTPFVTPRLVERALERTGRQQRRTRRLPAALMVYFVLACCLLPGSGYAGVIRHLAAGLGWSAGRRRPPAASSLAQARHRLTAAPLRALFDQVRGPLTAADTDGTWRFGLRVTMADGTTVDLQDTPDNEARFGRPARGGFPQARLVIIMEAGTRAVINAAWDAITTSEQELFDQMLTGLDGHGMLLLADKNFLSYQRWQQSQATGAQLLWRVRNGTTFPLPQIRKLPDGSWISRLFDPKDCQRRRKAADRGQQRPGWPEGITVRVIPYTVTTMRADGSNRTTYYRLITTLLEHHKAPAKDLAACYHDRWQEETGLADLKTRQLPAGSILRSKTPDGVNQEIAAHLIIYQGLRRLALHAAEHAGVPCHRISFTAVHETAVRQLTSNAAATGRALHTALTDAYQEITSRPLPTSRRTRSYPRHVKRPTPRYPANRGDQRQPGGKVRHRTRIGTGTGQPPTPVPDP